MHDKQVRRRRAVLAVLVAISLILLTAYFGESPSSPLHTLQRGIVEVFSPVQEGASKVLTPFKDVANFFSDTFKAKSQVGQLRKQVRQLQAQLARLQYAADPERAAAPAGRASTTAPASRRTSRSRRT